MKQRYPTLSAASITAKRYPCLASPSTSKPLPRFYAYRSGDANMRSVWLCSRNDAIGNIAVVLAAIGVAYSATGGPDLAVAAVMGVLSLTAAKNVVTQARGELAAVPPASGVSAGS